MSTAPAASRSTTRFHRLGAAALGATLLVGAFAGTASAKEVGSGGTGTVTTTCNPVTSLSYKGDATTGETGQASITVSYGVKPCDKLPVVVEARLYLTANPAVVPYLDANAPLSGKVTVFGVTANTSYTAKITVRDAATGTVVGSSQIFAAAKYKPV